MTSPFYKRPDGAQILPSGLLHAQKPRQAGTNPVFLPFIRIYNTKSEGSPVYGEARGRITFSLQAFT